MKEPRKVRGLFGVLEAEANGEEWEFEQPSADYVPGMGLGATKEATRWAWLGYQKELGRILKKRGRKTIDPLKSTPARRAFHAWKMCKKLRADTGQDGAIFSNRELIAKCQEFERDLGLNAKDRLFRDSVGQSTLDSSLSVGKGLLEIDERWNSEVCEKILRDLFKTT